MFTFHTAQDPSYEEVTRRFGNVSGHVMPVIVSWCAEMSFLATHVWRSKRYTAVVEEYANLSIPLEARTRLDQG